MARTRVVFARRYTSAQTYESALVADFAARGWTVDEVVGWTDALPSDPTDYDDVALVVIGAPGTGNVAYASSGALEAIPAPILTLCRATAVALGLGSNYTATSISTMTRLAGVTDPRASVASFALSYTSSHLITPYSWVEQDYSAYSSSRAGICRKTRTVGSNTFESIFFGYHQTQNLSGDALTVWHAYTGGTEDSPREARAALGSPLAPASVLGVVDAEARAALRSPLGTLAALALERSAARLALDGPLSAQASALVAPATSVSMSLPSPLVPTTGRGRLGVVVFGALASPLGAISGVAAVAGWSYVALPSPLGDIAALVQQLRAVVSATAPAARPALLSDPLPLRHTSDLPTYLADAWLPWVYGTVTLSAVPWDTIGQRWLLADHPISAVHRVQVDGQAISGWELANSLDDTGHAVAVLRLSRAADVAPVVSLSGLPDSRTGALLTHPADICLDLLHRCGWAPDLGAFEALRELAPDLVMGGVLDQETRLREALSTLVSTCGADWSGAPLRVWALDDGDPIATVGPALIDSISATSDCDGLVTSLRVTYAWDWARGAAGGSLRLAAPEAIVRHGRIEGELSLPWVRHARHALALGTRYLERGSRPRWEFRIAVPPSSRWAPGDRLTLAHPWAPTGAATVTALDRDGARCDLTLERPAGPVDRITTRSSGELVARATPALGVTYSDGTATFVILDDAGVPLADAAVTLDGVSTRTTDRQGRVSFRTGRGAHTLTVVAAGYVTQELEVEV